MRARGPLRDPGLVGECGKHAAPRDGSDALLLLANELSTPLRDQRALLPALRAT